MRIRPLLWFWALIPIAVLWVIATGVKMDDIERDVFARASAELKQAGYDWAELEADVRDLRLKGSSPDKDVRRQVVARLTQVPGVRTVTDVVTAVKPAPVVKPAPPADDLDGKKPASRPAEGAKRRESASAPVDVPAAQRAKSADEAGQTAAKDATANSAAKPKPPAFRLLIQKRKKGITLTGTVAADGDRVRIADAVDGLMPKLDIDEDLAIGADAPRSWLLAVNFGLVQLAGLNDGRLEIDGTNIKLSGKAIDGDSAFKLRVRAENDVPEGFMLSAYEVEAPREGPFEWTIERTADAVKLTGTVPTDEQRKRLVESARTTFPGLKIEDGLELIRDAPRGWEAAARLALDQVRRLANGKVTLLDTHYTIQGEVYTGAALTALRDASKSVLPSGFTGSEQLVLKDSGAPLESAECQARISAVISARAISFAPASDVIDRASYGQLDHIAYLARACPAARVEVSGHTDSRGNATFNRGLSRRRAAAVVTFLIESGVDAERLTAVGFGADQPVAGNNTEDGRARNRRIEFTLSE